MIGKSFKKKKKKKGKEKKKLSRKKWTRIHGRNFIDQAIYLCATKDLHSTTGQSLSM